MPACRINHISLTSSIKMNSHQTYEIPLYESPTGRFEIRVAVLNHVMMIE